MSQRLLVLRAGTGASNNLIRSLRLGDPVLVVIGAHSDRFVLKNSAAEQNYLLPDAAHPAFVEALRETIRRGQVDLLVPDTEPDVALVSDLRDDLPCRVFLPAHHVVVRCQDKYELTTFLRSHGLAAPLTYPVTDLATVADVFARLPVSSRIWCRMRRGAGSMGAAPMRTADQARGWIGYWQDMRGVDPSEFTLSEYLPGRDYSAQGLWKDGRLVLIKMSERLSYFGGASRASGMSSTPGLAKTILEPAVLDLCVAAITALDPRASGVFSFDLKESAEGVPHLTEINAGRFAMITPIYDLTGKHNMATTYVRLAFDERPDIADPYDVAEDHYLVRDLDTLPGVFDADSLFDGIEQVRAG